MALIDEIKTGVLRITHTKLDADINTKIAAAQADMVRIGVPSDIATSTTNALVKEAIKTYVAMRYASEKESETLYASYMVQVDGLRKSTFETEETDDV